MRRYMEPELSGRRFAFAGEVKFRNSSRPVIRARDFILHLYKLAEIKMGLHLVGMSPPCDRLRDPVGNAAV